MAQLDDNIKVQLLDLERQIMDEFENRQQLGERLSHLELENSKLRQQLSAWKTSVECPNVVTRSGSSSIDLGQRGGAFDEPTPAFHQDPVSGLVSPHAAAAPSPLDGPLLNAIDACLMLSAANAQGRAALLRHLDQRRSLATELAHLQKTERLRWDHLFAKARTTPLDPAILGDESPFESAPADLDRLLADYRAHFASLIPPSSPSSSTSTSSSSAGGRPAALSSPTLTPTPLFTALHPSLLTSCYKAGAPSSIPLSAPFSAATFAAAAAAVPNSASSPPRSALGVGAALSVASAAELQAFESSGNSLAQLMMAAGLGGGSDAAGAAAAAAAAVESGGGAVTESAVPADAFTDRALQFVVTALESNRAAFTEARAAIERAQASQAASSSAPGGGSSQAGMAAAHADLIANLGFAPPRQPPTQLMATAQTNTGLPSGVYPFDQPDSEDNVIFEAPSAAAAAAAAAVATASGKPGASGADAPSASDSSAASSSSSSSAAISADNEPPIRFASLYKLVERVCRDKGNDMNLRYVFLLTYRSFTQPLDLLAALQHRFYVPYPPNLSGAELELFKKQVMAPIQIKVCSVLKNWIEEHWLADFAYVAPPGSTVQKALDREQQAKQLLEETKAFLGVMSQDASGPWAAKSARALLALIKKKESAGSASTLLSSGGAQGVPASQLLALGAEPTRDRVTASVMEIGYNSNSLNGIEFPKPLCRLNLSLQEFDLTDCDELEIARQLTLLDFNFFRYIMPRECVDTAWSKKDRDSAAPHIVAFIDQFNSVSSWVQQEIVAIESLSKRAAMLKRFIRVGEHLMALNNFNSLFAIYCGLSTSAIFRLKKTWAELPAKSAAKWEDIRTLFKMDRNSLNFREVLKRTICPCIPYLGLFLGDLTFMEDGNPGMGGPNGTLINVQKRRMIADRIKWIQQYQQTAYVLRPVPAIQEYLKLKLKVVDDNTVYKESLRVEPRESS